MSLGDTMAWIICTNRAGVWIFVQLYSLFHGINQYYFVAIGDAQVISNIRWSGRVSCIRGFPL